MAPLRHIACLVIGTLVCLLLASTAVAAPPEGKLVLLPLWKKTTVGLATDEDFNEDVYAPIQQWINAEYADIVKRQQMGNRPLIPPAVPVVLAGVVAYTSDRGVAVRVLSENTKLDPPLKQGDLVWAGPNDNSFYWNARHRAARRMAEDWFKRHKSQNELDLFFHRTLSMGVSVQNDSVIAMDEIGLFPPKDIVAAGYEFGVLSASIRSNTIKQWSLETGKLVDRLPNSFQRRLPDLPQPSGHWLGLPLIVDESCFLAFGEDGIIGVMRISWQDFKQSTKEPPGTRIYQALKWTRALARTTEPLAEDVKRRIHAIYLTKASKYIICPTNLGRVQAFSSISGDREWTHEYAPLDAKRFPTFAPEWVVVPPVVVGDRYIYAPADFPELLCLNVADGKKVWSVKKGDGLYPAVIGEQVLVIGEKTLRSLSLKDGNEQWKIDLPGLPCGRGAMLGDTYLLPISEPKTWRGMIAIVDLKTQKIREVLKPEKDEPIGNLVVHQDMLISQTLTEIAVYPIRK